MLTGIDISHWQGVINWAKVAQQARFAILKCTEGAAYKDDRYAINKSGCSNNGIPHGVYHFFRSNSPPIAQAENFYNTAHDPDLSFYCVDVEANNGGDIRSILKTMLDCLEDLTGHIPWIYTAKYFWNANIGAQPWASRCPLWVANYSVQQPALPNGWNKWGIWQYSSHGSMEGIAGNVDMNIFNDNEYDLHTVFGNGEAPPLPSLVRVRANMLNLRATPGGAIIGHIPGGFVVHPTGIRLDSTGKAWYASGPNAYFASWWVDPV